MKVIVPYVYNWEGKIEQKLLEKENQNPSELTNDILSIVQAIVDDTSKEFQYSYGIMNDLNKRIDQLDQKVTAIEGDVKINRKLIDAITFVKNSKDL
jgi:hypothetical protein|nr:MAG TPA: Heat shock factor-binding protein 1 helix, Nucleus, TRANSCRIPTION.8A [Caudoviricetes sp.]